jgi:cytidylate kinase
LEILAPKLTIAIDGFAACGKSTLARDLSKKLNYGFLDTGAMYRSITWCAMEHGLDLTSVPDWQVYLEAWPLEFSLSEKGIGITFDGKSILSEIRNQAVAERVSTVAAISPVRRWLVKQQQQIGARGGVILDGRDIGTVVFPDADLKLFVTADLEVRVRRRYDEMQSSGMNPDLSTVRSNLVQRDTLDSQRTDSPLQPAPDALWLDTTRLTRDRQLAIVEEVVQQLIQRQI